MAGRLSRGDVFLCRFPHPDKQRPVVVLTRDSSIGSLSTVTVAPITTTIRGAMSQVLLNIEDGMKELCVINLHGVVTVDRQHLVRYVAHLSPERMQQICAALRFSLECS